jgi:hypothetical protein
VPFQLVDGNKVWEPNKRQTDFIKIPDSIFEAMYGGAAGGGKSEILLMLPIVRGWYQNAFFKGIIFRRTFPELEESLIPRSRDIYPLFGATYNDTKHRWTFPSGAWIQFSYMLRAEDARSHDTAEYNYIGFDELTAFEEFQYVFLTSRCRTSDSSLPAIVRGATNPGNVGHAWVRRRFVEPARAGYTKIFDRAAKSYRIFIPAKLTDNQFLMQADPNYINRLQLLPLAERKAKLEGDWWTFTGQVFDEYRFEHFAGEPQNALHLIDRFDIPSYWPRIVGIDWGHAAMTWIGWAAIAPNGQTFIYRQYGQKNRKIVEWASDFVRLSQEEIIDSVVIDPSAKRREGDLKSILQQFSDVLNPPGLEARFKITLADNDRISGKMLMHEYLRWKPKPPRIIPREGFNVETGARIFRIYGEKSFREYSSLFEPEKPETNLPKLQIFKDSRMYVEKDLGALEDVIPLCIYDDTRMEDVMEFDGDDPYDGCRYLVKEVHRWIEQSVTVSEDRERLNSVLQYLQETGNMTGFYRKMEKLERDKRHNDRPVKLFHKRPRRSRYPYYVAH